MENCVIINLKQNQILIKLAEQATHEEILTCMKEKIPQLSKLYQEEKIPIYVTGKVLEETEIEEIKELIKKEIDVEIQFETYNEMGLSGIKKVYEKDTKNSPTKFHKGSLRCGQKIEFDGNVVIIGDVNGGAEVIASDNIIILGILRGLAHAGAKGNKKAIIATNIVDSVQIRISNLIKQIRAKDIGEKKVIYASIIENKIVIE